MTLIRLDHLFTKAVTLLRRYHHHHLLCRLWRLTGSITVLARHSVSAAAMDSRVGRRNEVRRVGCLQSAGLALVGVDLAIAH